MTQNRIDKIIRILRTKSKRFKVPIVTKVSRESRNPFLVLISCILSLRTKDEVTAQASKRLFKLGARPEEILKLTS